MTNVNDQFTQSDLDVWRDSLHDLIKQAHAAEIPPYEIHAELQYAVIALQTGFMKAMFETTPE